MTNEELIEEMRDAWMNYRLSLEYGQTVITADGMKKVLSVVKSHIGSVAEVCPHCGGSPEGVPHLMGGEGGFGGGVIHEHCKLCNGSGVIARGG
jgi:hypothetical protein